MTCNGHEKKIIASAGALALFFCNNDWSYNKQSSKSTSENCLEPGVALQLRQTFYLTSLNKESPRPLFPPKIREEESKDAEKQREKKKRRRGGGGFGRDEAWQQPPRIYSSNENRGFGPSGTPKIGYMAAICAADFMNAS